MSLSSCEDWDTQVQQLDDSIDGIEALMRDVEGGELGGRLIQVRERVDRFESIFAGGLRSFDRSGEYAADGALNVTAWLRWKCKLTAGAAAERVSIAHQMEKLPKFEEAFARGEIGYQHMAVITRSAEHVGAAAVRKEEAKLLEVARTMDPGQFTGVAKSFEHADARADAGPSRARRPKARVVTRAIEANWMPSAQ
jgi:hypothetical protein